MWPPDTWALLEIQLVLESAVDCRQGEVELDSQLMNGHVGPSPGFSANVSQHLPGQFRRPACLLDGSKVSPSCECGCHPAMDSGGTEGMVAVYSTQFSQDIAMSGSLSG